MKQVMLQISESENKIHGTKQNHLKVGEATSGWVDWYVFLW